jgi:hypothetical protein
MSLKTLFQDPSDLIEIVLLLDLVACETEVEVINAWFSMSCLDCNKNRSSEHESFVGRHVTMYSELS